MALEFTTVYLLLGGNLGDRELNLKSAIRLINDEIGKITQASAVYETAAWGKTDQPAFLNQAVELSTNLSALEVLNRSLDIEKKLGRVRLEKWSERLIDIDLILFGNQVINIENTLQVPHPYMQKRKFVMLPLAEIAPNAMHPVLKKTISEMTENISDSLDVRRLLY